MSATNFNWDDEIELAEEARRAIEEDTLVDLIPSLLRGFAEAILEAGKTDGELMSRIGIVLCGIAAAADKYHGRGHLFQENEGKKVVH